jgi:hypothetical protein
MRYQLKRQDALDFAVHIGQHFNPRTPCGVRHDYNISVENGELEAYSRDRKRLCELPSALPERKKGEWSDGYRWQRCSLCKQTGKKSWNYCPHCGADMRGEKDERTD